MRKHHHLWGLSKHSCREQQPGGDRESWGGKCCGHVKLVLVEIGDPSIHEIRPQAFLSGLQVFCIYSFGPFGGEFCSVEAWELVEILLIFDDDLVWFILIFWYLSSI